MIIFPTKGRPKETQRLADQYMKTSAITPVYMVVEKSDAKNYENVNIPESWTGCIVDDGVRIGDIFNQVFKQFPNEAFYGVIADDLLPQTHYWDIILAHYSIPGNIAWGDDGIQGAALPTFPFIGGDLVRKLGWLAAPGIKHWYVDNVWLHLAQALKCARYLHHVHMSHLHPVAGLAPNDDTYKNQPSHEADQQRYQQFMESEFHKIVTRVRSMK